MCCQRNFIFKLALQTVISVNIRQYVHFVYFLIPITANLSLTRCQIKAFIWAVLLISVNIYRLFKIAINQRPSKIPRYIQVNINSLKKDKNGSNEPAFLRQNICQIHFRYQNRLKIHIRMCK